MKLNILLLRFTYRFIYNHSKHIINEKIKCDSGCLVSKSALSLHKKKHINLLNQI
jgi:hypothetical protein